jgi:tripartite ATP-independent transporter DctP family solute receptor
MPGVSPSRRAFVVGGACAFASIGIIRSPAKAADFSYKYANNAAVEYPRNVRARQMVDAIRNESKGRLEIAIFPNGSLGSDSAMLSQLRSGAIQFYTLDGGVLQSIVPAAGIQSIGFAWKDSAQAFEAFDGDLGAYVRKELAAKGLYAFEKMWSNGMRQITSSTHPIRTVDDLNGFKIRTPAGAIWVDLFKSLGASPTPINISELYLALQTKIVDGQENSFAYMQSTRVFEVQKYLSVTNHNWSAPWFLANPEALAALPADLRDVLERNVNKYALLDRRDTALLNASTADMLRREGLAFNIAQTRGFRDQLVSSGYYERWKREFGPTEWGLLEQYTGKLG